LVTPSFLGTASLPQAKRSIYAIGMCYTRRLVASMPAPPPCLHAPLSYALRTVYNVPVAPNTAIYTIQ